jgi:hypothetical protein
MCYINTRLFYYGILTHLIREPDYDLVMTFSIKKIFSKKDDSKAVEQKKTAPNDKPNSNSEKTAKHDSPTGCCGSCS